MTITHEAATAYIQDWCNVAETYWPNTTEVERVLRAALTLSGYRVERAA